MAQISPRAATGQQEVVSESLRESKLIGVDDGDFEQ
jgi:hypothetical protein